MAINVKVIKLGSQRENGFSTKKEKDYVWYGDKNDYPQYLLDLSYKSALHTAILDKKVKKVQGLGFTYDAEEFGDNKNLDKFLEYANPDESLNDILEKIANDLEIFGGYYLQVIWNKKGTKILELYHVPFEKIRSGKVNDKGVVETYFYAEEWKAYMRKLDINEYPSFSTDKDKNKVQIYKCVKYKTGSPYYGAPSYVGATLDIETLAGISDFHNNNLRNSFNPGILLLFRGPEPTEEEMDTIVKNIQTKYGGTNNAGEPIIMFLDGEQREPKIEQLQASDLDKLFDQLNDTSQENVTLAHSIPRIIAGLETPGSLGASKEVIEGSLIFFNDYIEPEQKFILRMMNKLLANNNYPELSIINSNPSIILYSEALLEKVLTQDEMRELFGYEQLEIGEETIEEDTEEIVDEPKASFAEKVKKIFKK